MIKRVGKVRTMQSWENGMQGFIIATDYDSFKRNLSKSLSEGWRVVPGTMYATSLAKELDKGRPPTQSGTRFSHFYFVALERGTS